MKTQRILLYAVLAILAGRAIAQQVFYPLDIGTRWQWSFYSGTGSYSLEIARDTLVSNGHRYSIVPTYWSMPERWERQDGNRVYRYNPVTQQEWLLFDFSKFPHDTINLSPLVILAGSWNDTLFGATRRIWAFNVGSVQGIPDAGAGYNITDSIGLTDYSDWNSALRVVGAKIGSRIYGTVTNVFNSAITSPSQIQLYQSYPNPFNGQATIHFRLAREANVSLRVIDITGKMVDQLVDNRLAAGEHRFVWDAASFASGVYYCELIASSDRRMIRLVHVK